MKPFLPLAMLLALLGCVRPVQVAPCPEPPLVQDPIDPVDALGPSSTPAETARAYAASRLLWRQAARERGRLLDTYRKRP
jgi:hypothetical protein